MHRCSLTMGKISNTTHLRHRRLEGHHMLGVWHAKTQVLTSSGVEVSDASGVRVQRAVGLNCRREPQSLVFSGGLHHIKNPTTRVCIVVFHYDVICFALCVASLSSHVRVCTRAMHACNACMHACVCTHMLRMHVYARVQCMHACVRVHMQALVAP